MYAADVSIFCPQMFSMRKMFSKSPMFSRRKMFYRKQMLSKRDICFIYLFYLII